MKALNSLIMCLILLCGTAVLGALEPQWQWTVNAGGIAMDYPNSIAVDSQGNQYIIGRFEYTATFGSHTLTAIEGEEDYGKYNTDLFVAKLDPSGNWLWAVQAGGTGYEEGFGIAVDGAGNAYVTGFFESTATFGSHTLTASEENEIFAAKLDPSGNWLWAVQAGGADADEGHGITVDGAGNAWVTGFFRGTATFGSHTLTASSGSDIFVAKLDTDGNWLWVAKSDGTGGGCGKSIAVDAAGNAWVTGYFQYTVTFGSHTLTSNSTTWYYDVFVAKLDPSGNWLWAVGAGGSTEDWGRGIAVDAAGNAWVTGSFTQTATFGSQTLTSNSEFWYWDDAFIAKLDPSGNWLWAVQAGGSRIDFGSDITLDGSGNAYVTGSFGSTAAFGSVSLTASGSHDIFVAKLDPSGNWLWTVQAGGNHSDISCGIALDGAGNACVAGNFYDNTNFGNHALTSIGYMDLFVAKLQSPTPVEDALAPQAVARLHNAYPNPLVRGSSALIKADIPENSTGTLSIFNLRGQLLSRQRLSKGSHEISFSGEGLPAGVYLYSLQCGDYQETKKLVLIK